MTQFRSLLRASARGAAALAALLSLGAAAQSQRVEILFEDRVLPEPRVWWLVGTESRPVTVVWLQPRQASIFDPVPVPGTGVPATPQPGPVPCPLCVPAAPATPTAPVPATALPERPGRLAGHDLSSLLEPSSVLDLHVKHPEWQIERLPDAPPPPPPPPLPPPPPPLSEPCDGFYGEDFQPVTGRVRHQRPDVPRPAKGVVVTDTHYRTCVVRATAHASEPPVGFARNDYSRRQAFNVDNTLFIVSAQDGFFHLYDANSLQHIRRIDGMDSGSEPQWHPGEPDLIRYFPRGGGLQIREINVWTSANRALATMPALPWPDAARAWTRWEGSPSSDHRYWCLMAETANFAMRGVFVYDLVENRILGSRSISAKPDHTSMSPSGRWCVVSSVGGTGTVAWNRTMTQSVQLHATSEHSDIAVGADGNDYYVFLDYQSHAGDLVMVNIDTGVRTTLFETYINGTGTAYHVSGKNFDQPGWVLISTYAASTSNHLWLHEKIMAVELAPNPTIVNLAHHHSRFNEYWTEPHASVNRDFTRVLFNSNWGTNSSTDVDAYLIQLPPDLLD